MGFSRIILNREILITTYINNSINEVLTLFTKYESVGLRDSFSSKLYELLDYDNYNESIKLIKAELDNEIHKKI